MEKLQLIRNCVSRRRAAAPGLLLVALGLAALAVAAGQPFRLESGRPGPGFVPSLLAAALVLFAALHAVAARPAPATSEGGGVRAGLMLCAAVGAFALLLPWAGFLPAAWATGSLTLAAAPGIRLVRVVAGGGALALAAAAIFLGGLGLPTPLLGSR